MVVSTVHFQSNKRKDENENSKTTKTNLKAQLIFHPKCARMTKTLLAWLQSNFVPCKRGFSTYPPPPPPPLISLCLLKCPAESARYRHITLRLDVFEKAPLDAHSSVGAY